VTEPIRVGLGESGIRIYPLMLGTGEFGWNVNQASATSILDRFVELGGNALYTSDSYAAGRSEHIVGTWMRECANRDEMVVCVRVGGHEDNPGLGSVSLVRAVEASLERLGIERIDVLYLDATLDSSTHTEDILATSQWLHESGKIGAIGAYGFSTHQLIEARILGAADYPHVEVIDTPYNLLQRTPFEGDLQRLAITQGISVTPSHALAHGFLSGNHRVKGKTGHSVRGGQLRDQFNRRGIRVLEVLDSVATDAAVPVAAVALGWLLAQRQVVAPIVNPLAASHVTEIMQSARINFTRAQLSALERASL
jgi:aryl-alcohol dehydrogenase-like predicted oxidoreductase